MQSLRELIRFILKEEVLGEPDESAEDEREEDSDEQAVAGAVAGATTPLLPVPDLPLVLPAAPPQGSQRR